MSSQSSSRSHPDLAAEAQSPEEIDARRLADQPPEEHVGDELRGHQHGLGPEAVEQYIAELAGVGGVPAPVEHGLAVTEHVGPRIDDLVARRHRAALVVDRVAEGIDRPPEADHAGSVGPDQLAEEGHPAVHPRELVVLDDVAGPSGLLEVILDQRLGLHHQPVVDGGGHEPHRSLDAEDLIARERLHRRAGQAELEVALDHPRAAAGPTREEERVIAALDHHRRVGLQDVLVEVGLHPAIDPIGAEVVHEEADDRVGEEVLARAVDHGCQPGAIERVAKRDRVQVGRVGGDVDQRACALEVAEQLHLALHRQHLVEGAGAEPDRGQLLGQRRGPHHPGQELRRDGGGEAIDPRIEVAGHVFGHPLGDPAQRVALRLVAHPGDAAQEPAPVAELLVSLLVALLLEPAGLVEGHLVERVLEAAAVLPVPIHDASDHLADDVVALTVEPEDRRVVRLGHVGL